MNQGITTYVLNLKKRKERLKHIKAQFSGKGEFSVRYVNAIEDEIGVLGLWKTIVHVITLAKEDDEELIILCEDDHIFTEHYRSEMLFKAIRDGRAIGAELIIGGTTGGFNHAIPVSDNLVWVDAYLSNQLLIIYRSLFDKILQVRDFDAKANVDNTLSMLSAHKFAIVPYISVQENFNYSDVTFYNNLFPSEVAQRFRWAEMKLVETQKIYHMYHSQLISNEIIEPQGTDVS
ncbi:hypothetical protein [Sphingobacterium suaedae]|uniref:Glycosyl transferase n=1 Tax=Sphingobacterium suaedae TaxID=1686402 RepID=A0ABW5KL69_9SPHI